MYRTSRVDFEIRICSLVSHLALWKVTSVEEEEEDEEDSAPEPLLPTTN